MTMTIERRAYTGDVEARQTATGKVIVSGYAAVFLTPSSLLGGRFVEQVGTRAFAKTLADGGEVRAYRNHDVAYVLGSLRSGTLRVSTDNTGLHYEYDHAPDISYARDLLASIERQDVRTSSFAFSVMGRDGEGWGYTEDEIPLRTLNEVRLFDVSPVTGIAAYGDATSVGMSHRSVEALAELRGLDPAAFADSDPDTAFRSILDGFPPEDTEPQIEDEPTDEQRSTPLSIHRARLQLLQRAPTVR